MPSVSDRDSNTAFEILISLQRGHSYLPLSLADFFLGGGGERERFLMEQEYDCRKAATGRSRVLWWLSKAEEPSRNR